MATKMRKSSGNVFKDLGFAPQEAQQLGIRAGLMAEIGKLIEARGLTQKEAAALLRVSQPRISDLVRGKIERFSIDTLVEMLGHAGIGVRFTTQRHVA